MDSSLIVTLAAASLTWAIIYYHLKVFSYWSSRGVPGPQPWPIFGTNIYYIFINKLELDRKWRQQYGHTYGLYEGYYPLLRTTDNELIKNIYLKQFGSFTDRNSRFVHGRVQKNWLLWSKGLRWANQRALVSPMFSSAKMRPMFNSMSDCVDRFLAAQGAKSESINPSKMANQVTETKSASWPIERAVPFGKSDLSHMTLDVIATCFFGLKLDTYDVAQNEFLREAYKFSTFNVAWFIVWLLTPTIVAKYLEIDLFRQSRLNYFTKLTQRVLDERRRNKEHGKADIIQAFIDAKLPDEYEQVFSQEDDKEAHYNDNIGHEQLESLQKKQTSEAKYFKRFTDLEIKGQMAFLFLAGFETTAATLSFASLELAAHPEIQDTLHAELMDKFKCTTEEKLAEYEFSKDNYADLLDLKQLDCFVSEVLRLYSPILEHTRVVTDPDGVTVESANLPKPLYLAPGVAIATDGFTLQRDEDYFERPDEFDMTRFSAQNRAKIKPATFMPFGLGPRHCAGMRFALIEIKVALAKILAKCRVEHGSSCNYPPKFIKNAIFLSTEKLDFRLTPRIPVPMAAVALVA